MRSGLYASYSAQLILRKMCVTYDSHKAAIASLYNSLNWLVFVLGFLSNSGLLGANCDELMFFIFGGLGVACWPLVPKFAGSNPAEAVGFLRA